MSSNTNHISLSNYEEWFVLYMDNELSADEKGLVDAFLLLHPHLQEELDLLLSTKLPAEEMMFSGKEDLKAEAMKLNVVDDSLLLYIDNELTAADKKTVEEKLAADKNLQLQYELLLQTKLDASEVIPHPAKAELYRHTEKVIFFPAWMRVAVVVALVLFATLFVVFNSSTTKPVKAGYVDRGNKPIEQKPITSPFNIVPPSVASQQQIAIARTEKQNKTVVNVKTKNSVVLPQQKTSSQQPIVDELQERTTELAKVEPVKIDVKKLTERPTIPLNNVVANLTVTSTTPVAYNQQDDPNETAGSNGNFKKTTSAKGLLRKVSRFIERRTGIGTVNADNELLVGAVALKLN